MAFNDNAVFTAATGYIYTAPVGTAAPTPAQLDIFDPETFGANQFNLKLANTFGEDGFSEGAPTLTVGEQSTEGLTAEASAAEVQAALEKLSTVGTGGVVVSGTDPVSEGYTVSFIGDNFGKAVELQGSSGATVEEIAAASGWEPIGHTNNDELPEFGYDGGDSEAKGTWQKKVLKNITTETPVDYVTMQLLQFDLDTLEYYYGQNASKVANVFGIDTPNGADVERALLIVMQDGVFKISFSAAKCSIRRDDSIALASDEFSALPIRATFVKHPGRHLFEWTVPDSAGAAA